MATVAAAINAEEPWERQVDQALGAYLEAVAAQPGLSQSFVRELPALGKAGSDRQSAVVERFARQLVGLVELGRRQQPDLEAGPLTLDMALMIAGGIRELTVISIQQGRDVREVRSAAGGRDQGDPARRDNVPIDASAGCLGTLTALSAASVPTRRRRRREGVSAPR